MNRRSTFIRGSKRLPIIIGSSSDEDMFSPSIKQLLKPENIGGPEQLGQQLSKLDRWISRDNNNRNESMDMDQDNISIINNNDTNNKAPTPIMPNTGVINLNQNILDLNRALTRVPLVSENKGINTNNGRPKDPRGMPRLEYTNIENNNANNTTFRK